MWLILSPGKADTPIWIHSWPFGELTPTQPATWPRRTRGVARETIVALTPRTAVRLCRPVYEYAVDPHLAKTGAAKTSAASASAIAARVGVSARRSAPITRTVCRFVIRRRD